MWDARSGVEGHVQAGEGAAHQIRLPADSLPQPQTDAVRSGIKGYARHVVSTEWPAMTAHEPLGQRGWHLLEEVRTANQVPDDATTVQQATSQEVLAQLSTLDDARRGREGDAESGL